ncbi:MAG: restriction endonuclease subunit S [Spirochaetia bacterium]|nr:restriction endonuclease subunit S [Spirochaetia bacterium]
MKEMKKLGDFIQPVDVRNNDLSVTHLLGVSVEKRFIESIANTIGTDFSKYKIVKKGQFTYIPDTSRRGDKIGIALLTDYDEGLVSNIYTVFEITDTSKLLPEYLMLWFSRPEFDRYARYKSHGSVREIFDWDEMCRVELPVPPLNEQQKIVDTYNAITNRIQIKQKINENLEKTAQAIYRKMFIEEANEKWEKRKLGTLVEIKRGGSPRPIQDYIQPSGYRWLKISDATASKNPFIFKTEEYISEDGLSKTVLLKAGSLILSNSATPGLPKILRVDSCIHDGWLYFPKSRFSNEYLYLLFQNIREDLKSRGNGSIFTNLKTDILKEYFVYVPDDNSLWSFQDKIDKLFYQILKNSEELNELEKLKQLVVSQISKR